MSGASAGLQGGEGLVRPRQFPEVGRAGLELQALCLDFSCPVEAAERV